MVKRILIKIAKKTLAVLKEKEAPDPAQYVIDGFLLEMGERHKLPKTQELNPMYDRFVPYLGALANRGQNWGGVIIDIGANVGDTTAGLIKHTDADVVCVEPTAKFWKLLQKNILGFGEEYTHRIKLVNAYIGRDESEHYTSKVTNGTAVKMKSDSAEAPTYAIPTVLKNLDIEAKRLQVVKVDTDGFDAECILSMGELLTEINPLLYWENEIDTAVQAAQYNEMADYLDKSGYTHYFVFDNFGNYLCCADKAGYKSICGYLMRILQKASCRTFYYVDVLASKKDRADDCKKAIQEYLSQFDAPAR